MKDKYREVGYVGPGKGRVSRVAGGLLATRKVASELTGGAYSLFELEVEPGGGDAPQVQHREDECLYVVSGQFEFVGEETVLLAGEGAMIYVPKGTLCSFRNAGEKTGRLLAIHTPGGSYESFVEEAGQPASGNLTPLPPPSEVDLDRLRVLGVEYGIEILASPP